MVISLEDFDPIIFLPSRILKSTPKSSISKLTSQPLNRLLACGLEMSLDELCSAPTIIVFVASNGSFEVDAFVFVDSDEPWPPKTWVFSDWSSDVDSVLDKNSVFISPDELFSGQ